MEAQRRNLYTRLIMLCCVMSAALSAPGAANADNPTLSQDIPGGLSIIPTLSQTGLYDTNPELSVTKPQALYGSVTSPEFNITDKTENALLTSDTLINENLFNLQGYSSTDVHSKNGFDVNDQFWKAGLNTQIDDDTTRSSEASIYGLNTLPAHHLGLTAKPDLIYSPLVTEHFEITGTAQSAQYSKTVFTNYDVFEVSPSYTHDFDELNSGIFTFDAQRYRALQGPRNVVDTFGPSIGWLSTLTPRLSFKVTAGDELLRQYQTGPTKPYTNQFTFSATATFKGEQDQADLSASRGAFPFGNGTEAYLTNFGLNDSHALNNNLSLNVGVNYEYADYQIAAPGNLQSLATGLGGLTYHMTEHLDITANYQYRTETLLGDSSSVDDHSVTFGLVYHPKPWTL